MRACIVGAGASGVAAARRLSEQGIAFEWFDRGDRVGGICASEREPHIDVSRERLGFADWPMPGSYPLFPRPQHVAAYLAGYVTRHGLARSLSLGTEVTSARRSEDGGWEVELDGGERRTYDALVVAVGRSGERRRFPALPGAADFAGQQLHADDCRDDRVLEGRDVVIAGGGAEAADLVTKSSYRARSTHYSIERPEYVIPLTVIGRPYDQFPGVDYLVGRGIGRGPASFELPWRLRHLALTAAHRVWFSNKLYGLPRPRYLLGAAPPVKAPQLMERLLHGRIQVRPGIDRLEGSRVRFSDGTLVEADTIVWCTGHRPALSFLPAEHVPLRDGRMDLYRGVFPTAVHDLAFVGLADPIAGSVLRIADAQARWVAECLGGRCALPGRDRIREHLEHRIRLSERRYVSSSRGAMQVEELPYVRELEREIRRGRRRSRRGETTVVSGSTVGEPMAIEAS